MSTTTRSTRRRAAAVSAEDNFAEKVILLVLFFNFLSRHWSTAFHNLLQNLLKGFTMFLLAHISDKLLS